MDDDGSTKLPWPSALALLYPLAAMGEMAWNTPAGTTQILGFGLAQLGYVCFAAGLIAGTFRILGLRKRPHVLIFAVLAFVAGTILTNMQK